ncbi:FAD/NAD(P)-binding protein [Rubrolithibacter danxiaensis]|uniref:FAD/NAD(P)-binding protein n=1 Tax=Rubrolithibacter danxiaensis TaxID=3390805 RepID=UPI003BF87333
MSEKIGDIAFVGSGLSCTYTLLHYIEMLEKHPPGYKVMLLVLEKDSEFWTGIPYGKRSGYNSLIINPLKDFIPLAERALFINWLKNNINWITDDIKERGGNVAEEWLRNNHSFISENTWEDIYIPRYVFGTFLKQRITTLLDCAVNNGLLEYQLIKADVVNIDKKNDLYFIEALDENKSSITIPAKKVILSIGSPPKKPLNPFAQEAADRSICYIEDIYEPDLTQNLRCVYKVLKKTATIEDNNILIIGSNASALEVFYNLENFKELKSLVNKFYIISPDGTFPHRINTQTAAFQPHHLNLLKNDGSCTARKIFNAVRKDVELAKAANISIADTIDPVSKSVIELLNNLNFHEQKLFVSKYGGEIGKLQRRAGGEYRDVVDTLVSGNKVEFIKGKFLKPSVTGQDNFKFEYLDQQGRKRDIDKPIKVIINCSGFQDLSRYSTSSLISNLISKKICVPNSSKRGFAVNESFEASHNFYLMGPLLAGNINSNIRVWHAESCSRIFSLSQQLAESLIERGVAAQ